MRNKELIVRCRVVIFFCYGKRGEVAHTMSSQARGDLVFSGAHRDGYTRANDMKRNRGDGYFIKAAMVAQSLDLGDQRRLVLE